MRKFFLGVAVLIGFAQASAHASTVSCPANYREYKLNVANVNLEGARLIAMNNGARVTMWSASTAPFLETPFAMDNETSKSDVMGWTSLGLIESVNKIQIDRILGHSIAVTVTSPGDSMNFYGCSLTN